MMARDERHLEECLRQLGIIAGQVVSGVLLAATFVAAHPARAAAIPGLQQGWVETWAAVPQQPVDPVEGGTPTSFSNQTIRGTVRISAGGPVLRLRLSNEAGGSPVTISDVHVALSNGPGGIVPGSDHVFTFAGSGSVTIPPYAPALSDPIEFPVAGLSSLAVSLYVPSGGNTGAATPHTNGQQTFYIAPGDQTAALALTGAQATTVRYFVSGMDVLISQPAATVATQPAATVVALGDSITDGFNSTIDANHRWPDYLAQLMQRTGVLTGVGVANGGIAGNRVLNQGIGSSALSRFDRDVLAQPGVRFVIVQEGINDIGFANVGGTTELTAVQVIAGYEQMISRAHERGILVFGSTLLPYAGSGFYTSSGEAVREAVNAWIRNSSGQLDGVIDFDAAVRNPANPLRLLPAYDSGDHLHPNDAGYAQMAASVSLPLFLQPSYQGP